MQPFYCPKEKYHCAWCNSRHTTVVLSNQHKEEDYRFYKKMDESLRKPKMHIHMKDFYPRTYQDDDIYPNFHPKKYPDIHPYPEPFPFPPNKFKKLPLNVIIRCDDCYKYTNIKEVSCRQCKKVEVVSVRIGGHIDPEEIFGQSIYTDHLCASCKYPMPPPCDHDWVKHSGEIFSECTAINFVCRFCGAKKTKYSNEDTPRDYDFYW